jgi:hypothetical protein
MPTMRSDGSQPMKISGPERYKLSFNSESFAVQCQKGTQKFSGIATSKKPKLYIVSVNEKPIYVGVTKQSLRNRLRLGWKASGEGGYYGYDFRHHFKEANIDVWCHENAPEKATWDIETVEAEVVFLIRCLGQWPSHQTEIHFHPSEPFHRDIAVSILGHFALRLNPPVQGVQSGIA